MGSTPLSGRRVLIVEDDVVIGNLLVEDLTDRGYAVQHATDGRAALDVLRSWPAELIVLDLMMAGMDGATFRAYQRADPTLAAIPVLLLSARPDAAVFQTALDARGLISKPFHLDDLAAAVAAALPEQPVGQTS